MTRAATVIAVLSAFLILLLAVPVSLPAEKKSSDTMSALQRDEALQMLQDTADKVRKEYYDPAFHGVDFEARYKEAQQKIRSAQTLSQAFGVIAWLLDGLNDSHTNFIPPSRPYLVQDGWQALFIGDACVITAVKEGSDAEKQGLKPGDRWCLCVTRWKEALEAGVAPPVDLAATHSSAVEFVNLEELQAHSLA